MKTESQLIKFFMGGLTAVSIDWGIFLLLRNTLDLTNTVSKTLSFMLGMLFAFDFNGHITFTSRLSLQKLRRHIVVYSISLLLNILIFNTLIRLQLNSNNLSTLIALFSATAVSMSINFLGMYFWVFSRNANNYD